MFHRKSMKMLSHFIFWIQNSIYSILRGCIFFFFIGVITAYEADLGRGTGPKQWAVSVTEICVLVCQELGLNIRKSFFRWTLFPFISRHLFPSVQLLRKARFVRVNDVTSTRASINILICRFQWLKNTEIGWLLTPSIFNTLLQDLLLA